MDKVATLFPHNFTMQERLNGAYNCALSFKAQNSAPLASYSVDRRCLYAYITSLADDKIDSLVCFACARRFPYVSSFRRNEINWKSPKEKDCFFLGMDAATLENILGFRTYLKKYGRCPGRGMPNLTEDMQEFDDWLLTIDIGDKSIPILCCSEDLACDTGACTKSGACCTKCKLPVCNACENALTATPPRIPAAALVNDMMIFYAPKEIYIHGVSVVEMICASPCITSMICCTLEWKHRKFNPLDSDLHMARHRMGARGNATSFPLPWSSLLSELIRLDAIENGSEVCDLPWTGEQLADKVSILLKTFDDVETDTTAKVIHQALVRRHVVLELIQ